MMIWIFFILQALSHESCDHCNELRGDPAHDIEEWSISLQQASNSLSWWSSSPQQTLNAPCKVAAPSDEEMLKWLDYNSSTEKISGNVHGYQLANESPENIRALELLLTARNVRGDQEPGRQKTFSSNCSEILCAVKEQFGSAGVMILYMQRRFGFNASHIANPDADLWKREELAQALVGVQDFPSGLFPMWESRQFVRYTPGQFPNASYGATTVADSLVRFFDRWTTLPPGEKQSTASHELGHAIAAETGIDRSPKWLALSGWEVRTTMDANGNQSQYYSAQDRSALVSGYGGTSPVEDFAESVAAYRYNPTKLLSASPAKYEFIKHAVFDGVEYTSPMACQNSTRTTKDLADTAINDLISWSPQAAELSRLSRTCLKDVFISMARVEAKVANAQEVEMCLDEIPKKKVREVMITRAKQNTWGEFMEPVIENAAINLPANFLQKTTGSGASLNNHLKQTLTPALSSVFQNYAPQVSIANCQSANFEEAHRYFSGVFQGSPNDPTRYYARYDIAKAMKQVCLSIARSRANPNASSPAKPGEIAARVKALVP